MDISYEFLCVNKTGRCLVINIEEMSDQGNYIVSSVYIPLAQLKEELERLDKNTTQRKDY